MIKRSAQGMSLGPGKTVAGRYELGDRLGAGALGSVYRATDTETGEPRAVKVFNPSVASHEEARRLFTDALAPLLDVQLPHAAKLHDLGYDETHGIGYEYMSSTEVGTDIDEGELRLLHEQHRQLLFISPAAGEAELRARATVFLNALPTERDGGE